jgi:hypothetical protein
MTLSDDEFVGYSFQGSPERRPRLWFLDRQLYPLVVWGSQIMLQGDDSELCDRARWASEPGQGVTEEELRAHAVANGHLDIGQWTVNVPRDTTLKDFPSDQPWEVIQMAMPGMSLRFESWGVEGWSMVWKLTALTIPHVHTFGKEDTWRLGVWPD